MDSQPPQKSPSPDREPSARDPEDPHDIVHDNILVLLIVALFVLFGTFALVIAFGG
jgi:hypothetical protein